MRVPPGPRTPVLLLCLLGLAVSAPARSETVPGGTRTAAPSWSGEAVVEDGVVRLRWTSGPDKVGEAVVERRVDDGPWADVAQVAAGEDGAFVYMDAAVTPGLTYGYRLRYTERKRTAWTDELRVTVPLPPGPPPPPEPLPGVPTPLQLAIERVSPSPVPRLGRLTFTVPAPVPVSLEVFDPGGRRVQSRLLSIGAAGRVTTDVGPGLRTGVYLVRLAQAGVYVTTRIVVLE